MNGEKWISFAKKAVLTIAVAVFFYSAFQLGGIGLEYQAGVEEYDRLEAMVLSGHAVPEADTEVESESAGTELAADATPLTSAPVVTETEETDTEAETTTPEVEFVDFPTLKSLNPDARGWITMYGAKVNYPVVQGQDNECYLDTTFMGKKNPAGALFIDYSIEEGMEAKNVIIYGHNMKNGSMFGTLAYYKNEQMIKNYPAFLVYTENGSYEYAIFAAFITTAGSDVYIYGFPNEESFLAYIERMKAQSLYDTGVEVSAGDKIMTLSTCSGKGDNRFVVLAKRVETGE